MPRPLYVTQPLLPDLAELNDLLAEIWRTKVLTNGGPLHQQLEQQMREHLDVPTAMLFNNGTIALLVALKLFDLPPGSEVITTPLTFAATAHAISWNGLTPVFADVLPGTLTIDPESVEKAISPKTSAILGVHVYGTVCELDALQDVADRNGLKLIYDAAHAFGARVNGRSIASYGDASVFSFHATKLFNTLEGGLIATSDPADQGPIYFLRNFGIKNEEEVISVGINGKLNEVQSAIGILNLKGIPGEIALRSRLRQRYIDILEGLPGIQLQPRQPGVTSSEQYFPVVVDASRFGRTRDQLYDELKGLDIFSRKYFHPICTDFLPYAGSKIHSVRRVPYVSKVKSQVLCLPFHGGVDEQDLTDIGAVFRRKI